MVARVTMLSSRPEEYELNESAYPMSNIEFHDCYMLDTESRSQNSDVGEQHKMGQRAT